MQHRYMAGCGKGEILYLSIYLYLYLYYMRHFHTFPLGLPAEHEILNWGVPVPSSALITLRDDAIFYFFCFCLQTFKRNTTFFHFCFCTSDRFQKTSIPAQTWPAANSTCLVPSCSVLTRHVSRDWLRGGSRLQLCSQVSHPVSRLLSGSMRRAAVLV